MSTFLTSSSQKISSCGLKSLPIIQAVSVTLTKAHPLQKSVDSCASSSHKLSWPSSPLNWHCSIIDRDCFLHSLLCRNLPLTHLIFLKNKCVCKRGLVDKWSIISSSELEGCLLLLVAMLIHWNINTSYWEYIEKRLFNNVSLRDGY